MRCRAETARMLFALAEQPYEDVRIQDDDWPQIKKTLPRGQLPILQIDDVVLCQSNAINRYLASTFGLEPDTLLEKAQIDMIVDCMEDLMFTAGLIWDEQDSAKKTAMQKDFVQNSLIPLFDQLEKWLKLNNGGQGFFVSSQVTIADLAFVNIGEYEIYLSGEPNILDRYPLLKALKDRVENIPQIKAWIDRRPKADC